MLVKVSMKDYVISMNLKPIDRFLFTLYVRDMPNRFLLFFVIN